MAPSSSWLILLISTEASSYSAASFWAFRSLRECLIASEMNRLLFLGSTSREIASNTSLGILTLIRTDKKGEGLESKKV